MLDQVGGWSDGREKDKNWDGYREREQGTREKETKDRNEYVGMYPSHPSLSLGESNKIIVVLLLLVTGIRVMLLLLFYLSLASGLN